MDSVWQSVGGLVLGGATMHVAQALAPHAEMSHTQAELTDDPTVWETGAKQCKGALGFVSLASGE